MQLQELEPTPTPIELKPPIYSKTAVRIFSILLSTAFGGFLLMQNLLDIGKKKQAYLALAASLAYAACCVVIVNNVKQRSSSLTYLLSIAGAYILTEYFFRMYLPDEQAYPKKKVWKPLIIGVILAGIIILGIVYSPDSQ